MDHQENRVTGILVLFLLNDNTSFSILLVPQDKLCFICTTINDSRQEDFSFRINNVFCLKQKQDTHITHQYPF